MAATTRAVEGLPSDTNTPSSSHIENEQRWANAGENLAVLNFSEKVRCLRGSDTIGPLPTHRCTTRC